MISKYSRRIFDCQISKKKDLYKFLDLGLMPAVNNFRPMSENRCDEIYYPTELFFSKSSKLVQLGNIVNKKILFPKTYPYTSSTTKILRDNFKKLSTRVNQIISCNKKDLIIDIGSNDGNLLSFFKDKMKVLGVTPENIGKKAIKKGIPTILDYFDDKITKLILKKYQKAKVITATNVFAHIDEIDSVITNIKKCLTKDGIFISESHYLIPLLKNLQYDTVYHEHLRYYSLTSLNHLFLKHNLEIFDAEEIPTHGGSIRVFCSRKGVYSKNKRINKIYSFEKKYLNIKYLRKFSKRVKINKIKLNKLLYELTSKNKKIAGISAPSRGSILVNYLGLDSAIIKNIFEIKGSYKINQYIPGTDILVKEESIKELKKNDYLFIFSWHIFDEIKKNLIKKGYKGKFIVPLPEPRII